MLRRCVRRLLQRTPQPQPQLCSRRNRHGMLSSATLRSLTLTTWRTSSLWLGCGGGCMHMAALCVSARCASDHASSSASPSSASNNSSPSRRTRGSAAATVGHGSGAAAAAGEHAATGAGNASHAQHQQHNSNNSNSSMDATTASNSNSSGRAVVARSTGSANTSLQSPTAWRRARTPGWRKKLLTLKKKKQQLVPRRCTAAATAATTTRTSRARAASSMTRRPKRQTPSVTTTSATPRTSRSSSSSGGATAASASAVTPSSSTTTTTSPTSSPLSSSALAANAATPSHNPAAGGGGVTVVMANSHNGASHGSSNSKQQQRQHHAARSSRRVTRTTAAGTRSTRQQRRRRGNSGSNSVNNNNSSSSNNSNSSSRHRSSSSNSSSASGGRARAAAAGRVPLVRRRGTGAATRRVAASTTTTAAASATAATARGTGGNNNNNNTAQHSTRATARVKPVTRAKRGKKVRVCVLNSSYEGTNSKTAAMDDFWCTPQHYVKKNKSKYTFADVSVRKADAYRVVRELVTSGKYDIFFNLCDGARDEKRAGIDVVQALEEMNAAFTGTDSHSFEPNKITMKLLVASSGVRVPNFVLLQNDEGLARKCRHLRFPVIVKHMSGYASVGVDKDSRCNSLDELRVKVRSFVAEYNHALVEEFVRGREGTVLACADTQSPHGVKVFRPLMFSFLSSPDDFAYFDKKWTVNFTGSAYTLMPSSDPAYGAVIDMARNAYKYIMNDVGYGRVDFRIDDATGEVHFLEINPNCGMWYSEKDGGDFADVMVQSDVYWDHERFFVNAVTRALREQAARRPWYIISHDKNGCFSTRATRSVHAGKCLFGDANHVVPVIATALFKLGEEEPTVGCVVCRGDGIQQAVAVRHSCEPNMHFVHGRTLLFAARRRISVGEELTVDYATLRDERMPSFACSCGTQNCRGVIFATPPLPRTVEHKSQRRMLREKKAEWLRAKASKAAERLIKKRAVRGGGGSGGSVHATAIQAGSSGAGSSTAAAQTTTATTTAAGAAAASPSTTTSAGAHGGSSGNNSNSNTSTSSSK